MSSFKLFFSGDVRKPAIKDISGKKAVEFQLMKKNYVKQGDEATFTWIRVTLFDAKDWQLIQCQEGKFVSGCGDFSLRSFIDKEGIKKQSVEIRCNSFDLDAPRADVANADAIPAKVAHRSVVPAKVDNEDSPPPF